MQEMTRTCNERRGTRERNSDGCVREEKEKKTKVKVDEQQ